jgi:hypothetical protein
MMKKVNEAYEILKKKSGLSARDRPGAVYRKYEHAKRTAQNRAAPMHVDSRLSRN